MDIINGRKNLPLWKLKYQCPEFLQEYKAQALRI